MLDLIIRNQDVEAVLTPRLCVEALEQAYLELGNQQAINGPRVDLSVPLPDSSISYILKPMAGVGQRYGAVRINTDLIHWPIINGKQRRARVPGYGHEYSIARGIILLFSTRTGALLALIDDGHLQGMRVGAAAAIAAKHLALPGPIRVGMVGSGFQSRGHLRCLNTVSTMSEVRVYSPNPKHRQEFADVLSEELGVPIKAVDSAWEAASDADVVMLARISHTQ